MEDAEGIARFTLKDRPKEFGGMYGEHVSFGKDNAVPMRGLAIGILSRIFDWCCVWMSLEELEENRQAIVRWLEAIRFEETGEANGKDETVNQCKIHAKE